MAFDADPATGILIYDQDQGGYLGGGGTSASAPQWAAFMARINRGRFLAGKPVFNSATFNPALYTQLSSSVYRDIVSGNNGLPAQAGYDPVTGLGSPVGMAFFNACLALP